MVVVVVVMMMMMMTTMRRMIMMMMMMMMVVVVMMMRIRMFHPQHPAGEAGNRPSDSVPPPLRRLRGDAGRGRSSQDPSTRHPNVGTLGMGRFLM
jgi:predicted lipid-binding transport protein (Tim44 family)